MQLANALKVAGQVLLWLFVIALLLLGRAAVGGGLISTVLAWYATGEGKIQAAGAQGWYLTVLTVAIEMEPDHVSGGLQGFVLAGCQEGKSLASLEFTKLRALCKELSSDLESRQLTVT